MPNIVIIGEYPRKGIGAAPDPVTFDVVHDWLLKNGFIAMPIYDDDGMFSWVNWDQVTGDNLEVVMAWAYHPSNYVSETLVRGRVRGRDIEALMSFEKCLAYLKKNAF